MPKNPKRTSPKLATLASKVLQDPHASKVKKTLAGSVLGQRDGDKQTSEDVESLAAKVLGSDKYSADTKKLAASAVSQSNGGSA